MAYHVQHYAAHGRQSLRIIAATKPKPSLHYQPRFQHLLHAQSGRIPSTAPDAKQCRRDRAERIRMGQPMVDVNIHNYRCRDVLVAVDRPTWTRQLRQRHDPGVQ